MKRQLLQLMFVHALMVFPLAGALADSVQAQKTPPSAEATHAHEIGAAYHEQLRNGGLMIGHMSLALMALEHGFLGAAGQDVNQALKIARTLKKSVPELKTKDTLRFGKVTHVEKNTAQVFYIPIMDDRFMVHGFDARGGKSEKTRETDAKVVDAHVSLDIRKAIGGLMDAKAALKKRDVMAAENALNGILSAAVVDEVIVSDPLYVAHDNLILAENLLREKRYDAVRYALKYSRQALGDYGSRVHDPDRKQHAEQMQKDIDAFSEQLRKEDPTTLQKAGDTVKGWGDEVKKWFLPIPLRTGSKPDSGGR